MKWNDTIQNQTHQSSSNQQVYTKFDLHGNQSSKLSEEKAQLKLRSTSKLKDINSNNSHSSFRSKVPRSKSISSVKNYSIEKNSTSNIFREFPHKDQEDLELKTFFQKFSFKQDQKQHVNVIIFKLNQEIQTLVDSCKKCILDIFDKKQQIDIELEKVLVTTICKRLSVGTKSTQNLPILHSETSRVVELQKKKPNIKAFKQSIVRQKNEMGRTIHEKQAIHQTISKHSKEQLKKPLDQIEEYHRNNDNKETRFARTNKLLNHNNTNQSRSRDQMERRSASKLGMDLKEMAYNLKKVLNNVSLND